MAAAGARSAASAATPPTLDLKVLLIGDGPTDVTTAAWEAALTSEGVPYTEATAAGSLGSETVTLPTLSSGTTGNFNAVVFADDPADFASGQLTTLYAYESTFKVRQVDGYAYPYPTLGQTVVGNGLLDGSTGTLTAAGLAAFPELKGPIPFDTGTYGSWSTVNSGAPFTPLLTNAAGQVLAGVYQHPATDPQAGVSELALFFDYNSSQLQWLLLAPGLINWVTQNTHLGLYRNYFGQDIDDTFLADNQWSSQYQCTPAATNPPDYTCPAGVANNPAVHAARCTDERGRRGVRGRLGTADRDQAEPGLQRGRRLHRPEHGGGILRQLRRQRHRERGHLHRSRPEPSDTSYPMTKRSLTPCSPPRPVSTGSPIPGRTCSSAARRPINRPSAR